jgi:hypothetical protein
VTPNEQILAFLSELPEPLRELAYLHVALPFVGDDFDFHNGPPTKAAEIITPLKAD